MAYDAKQIHVYENWSAPEPRKLGILYAEGTRGAEVFSFAYDEKYLRDHPQTYVLDPELEFYEGRQYVVGKPNFGIFTDSSPDRWGRKLIDRRERIQAEREQRRARTLRDSDYLLGVYDETRMGALRFALEDGGDFVAADGQEAVPPWVKLRTLEEASREFENGRNSLDDRWLRMLLRPGSSLGGARPKASVQDVDGSLWIAKFPSKNDDYNVGAWEKTVHELARSCGLNVPESRLQTFSELGSTFLVRRFDRVGRRRIHFSSAMTMLGRTDGASAEDGISYLDIASFLTASGDNVSHDLIELWRRIVFSIAVSNTDDHLRNHGFLLSENGWRLSPMYDVNPNYAGEGLSLNVNEKDNRLDIDLAIETAEYYGLSRPEAERQAVEICRTVRENWRQMAARYGIRREEMEFMRPAFLSSEWGR